VHSVSKGDEYFGKNRKYNVDVSKGSLSSKFCVEWGEVSCNFLFEKMVSICLIKKMTFGQSREEGEERNSQSPGRQSTPGNGAA
jgi:hypothetical protein